ncbi:MAG: 16S rRNA processing protein RimM [Acidobacteria bacterium]|nr:16S rRNA processing protein RimM [Acidobacteriota bacterium]MBV9071566.1 16S rRNA processing protein RimM [Acidobacteriota bacterium]MBV9187819.1 16S rRNA processing protein RimM [Acidobacteriota bacterium]
MSGDRIALGIIRKAHGVRGEASVEAWSDSPERFTEVSAVTLVSPDESSTRDAAIESVRIHAGRALVKFGGLDSPEEVQLLQNWTVEVPASEARKLDEDEYFLHDLIGLTLMDDLGVARGKVIEIEETGGGVLLVIEGPRGRFDVPFAADICTKFDLEARTIVVNLPEGIEDL